ncbi:helix-turn-helix domain-containing protein [uncultured Eubacterium sp.]|uniref:helix-turn-helix domain-containing protein n=1 Tax=uncultured Eubacterium sp. TaxID=165185 RepID=UPI0025CD7FB2|nr:helix-turn-helix domain-containing protein [uncultured Eubacterium sp.]MCI6537660.1 helix-turn-helix domain-containing protein [Lachnospiraceae bacterium]
MELLIWKNMRQLSEKMGKCRSSVKNALKELEDAGWIVRKFSGFSKPKHIYVLITDEKALCEGELRKWSTINATANVCASEGGKGFKGKNGTDDGEGRKFAQKRIRVEYFKK